MNLKVIKHFISQILQMAKKKPKIVLSLVLLATVCFSSFRYYSDQNIFTIYGNVDIRDVVLGFRVSGKIAKLHFDEGDKVKKGDIIASLDKEPFEIKFAIKKADLDQADANLIRTEKEYLRQKDLFAKKVISEKLFDDAKESFVVAVAQQQAAKANLDQAMLELKDADLRASEDGIIITRVREEGSIVSVGAPVYTLSLERPVWVRTYVDEQKLGHIYSGQKVIVKTDSSSQYEGQVGFISPQAEFTPKTVETSELRTSLVYRLRVIIQNPDNGLRQGMPVTVKILKDKR